MNIRITINDRKNYEINKIDKADYDIVYIFLSNLRKEFLSDTLEYEEYITHKMIENSTFLKISINDLESLFNEYKGYNKSSLEIKNIFSYFKTKKQYLKQEYKDEIESSLFNVKREMSSTYEQLNELINEFQGIEKIRKNILKRVFKLERKKFNENDINALLEKHGDKKISHFFKQLTLGDKLEIIQQFSDPFLWNIFESLIIKTNFKQVNTRDFIKVWFSSFKKIRNKLAHEFMPADINYFFNDVFNSTSVTDFSKTIIFNSNNVRDLFLSQIDYLHKEKFKDRFIEKMNNNKLITKEQVQNIVKRYTKIFNI